MNYAKPSSPSSARILPSRSRKFTAFEHWFNDALRRSLGTDQIQPSDAAASSDMSDAEDTGSERTSMPHK
jgi:hypothetical protein